jgi:oligopeptide transport system ATP-binding protein
LIMGKVLLEVKDLKKFFPILGGIFLRTKGFVHAVNGISFQVSERESLGIVGESGCGKSTAALTVVRLLNPTHGQIWFNGKEITHLNKKDLRPFRREMQIIFQDPYASLNPRMTVKSIIGDPMEIHHIAKGSEKEDRIRNLLIRVGLKPDDTMRFPHEFSGGQRQRIGIARTLGLNPRLIVADEPVSALDVSVQAQIINLLKDLQKEFGLTYVIIAHDLGVISCICNLICVMYLGKIVEIARNPDLFSNPLHPYTEALLSAIPSIKLTLRKRTSLLKGDVPNPIQIPSGCFFHPRCHYQTGECKTREPQLKEVGDNHRVACHLR